jgi:hypothetical protein
MTQPVGRGWDIRHQHEQYSSFTRKFGVEWKGRAAAGVAKGRSASVFRVKQFTLCLGCLTMTTEPSAPLQCYIATWRRVSMQQFVDFCKFRNLTADKDNSISHKM